MNEVLDGQVSMADLGMLSTKMFPEHSAPTEERTSKPSSRKSSASRTRKLPMCLCLSRGGGQNRDVCTPSWGHGPWPGGSMTREISECRKDERGLLWLPILPESAPLKFYLTINCGETQRDALPTMLSSVLENTVDPKYVLSPRACNGILVRAEKRGKALPPELDEALRAQRGAAHTMPEATETGKPSAP